MTHSAPSAVLFWPGTPLMVVGVNPRGHRDIARLRKACHDTLAGCDSSTNIVLVGEGDGTIRHDTDSWGTLAGFGVDKHIRLASGDLEVPGQRQSGDSLLPPSLTAGLLMLHAVGGAAARVTAVEIDPEGDGAAAIAGVLDANTIVVALGEGSARSTHSSPGPYLPTAAAADTRILTAIDDADPAALAAAAASAPADLQMSGLAVWTAVCSILGESAVRPAWPVVHARPFGVEYFVGKWSVEA